MPSSACLADEQLVFLVGDYQLDPCHHSMSISNVSYVFKRYTLLREESIVLLAAALTR